MAARIKSSSGINGNLFPTEFPVNNKLYKLLVKQSAIPLISVHRFCLVIFKTFLVMVKNSQHFNRQVTLLKRRLFLAPKIFDAHSNQHVQLQRLARMLTFYMKQV